MRVTGTPTTEGNYSLLFEADDGQGAASALADYQSRIGGAGVLWAHRFQSAENDIQGWQHSSNPASYNPDRQQFIAGGGIIPGDGALRQVYAGGEDWGGGSWRWCRPMQPMAGDINQPGVAELARTQPYNLWQSEIASVMHPDYQSPHGSPARTGPFLGAEIYFQFWMMLSPGRTSSGGDSVGGKIVMFENNYTNTDQELVMHVHNGSPRRTLSFYTSKGSSFNSALRATQTSGGGSGSSLVLPGSQYTMPSGPFAGQQAADVCSINNVIADSCWLWPEGEWMNWLIRVKPGHQAGSTASVSDAANNGSRDTVLEAWVATATEIRNGQGYTRMHSKSDYVWLFDNTLRWGPSGPYQPYGLNWFSLNHFTGGSQWAITPLTFWHQFDQLICSLQPIPCPTWAPEA